MFNYFLFNVGNLADIADYFPGLDKADELDFHLKTTYLTLSCNITLKGCYN